MLSNRQGSATEVQGSIDSLSMVLISRASTSSLISEAVQPVIIYKVRPQGLEWTVSRSEHGWREPFSKGPSWVTPPKPWTRAFFPVDLADAKPPSWTVGSAEMGSLCDVRPGVLGDIH